MGEDQPSTTDTESEDPDGNPRGVTPIVFACELIARTHGDLVVVASLGVAGETVTGLSANHATALKVLHEACDQVGWEFSVWNGALNVAENIGVDRTKDFVFRAGTNIEIASLGDGDDSLVNILTAQGPGRGINRLEITLRNEDSIAEYGPILTASLWSLMWNTCGTAAEGAGVPGRALYTPDELPDRCGVC